MLQEITLGQYYQGNSLIHKLDPRVKLTTTMGFIISLFLINNIYGYIIAALFLGMIIALSRVPFPYIIRGMRGVIFLLVLTSTLNIFLTPGEVIFSLWKLKITKEGIRLAVLMSVRLTFLIIGSSIMTLTTTPNHLTDGLEKILRPLKRVRVPVHEISMMISIALRFIPILAEETDKIMKAQMARGADFETGNIIKRAKALVPILVPLFVSSFRRANDLAQAMEARCYSGGEGRTKMKPLTYQKRDAVAYIILGFFVLLILTVGR